MSSSMKIYGTVSAGASVGATSESGLSVTHSSIIHPDQAEHVAVHKGERERYTRRKGCVGGVLEVVRANTGLLLVVAAQACFAMMNAAIQRLHKVDPPVTTLQLMIVQMLFTAMFCLVYMIAAKIPDPIFGPKGVRLLLLSRGIGGSMAIFGLYFSLQYLSLSDATILTFLVPTTTALAATIFLKEVYTIQQAMSGLVSLIGVFLIARPASLFGDKSILNFNQQLAGSQVDPAKRLLAVGANLFGVMGATIAYISIRAIGKRCHPMHAMIAFSIHCVIGSSIGMMIIRTPFVFPTGNPEWLILLCVIGVLSFMAQMFLTMGLQREAAGRGSMALYTQLIFAMILEFIFFRTYPTLLSSLGATMIIVSAVYVAMTKQTTKCSASEPSTPKHRSENQDSERAWLLAPENDDGGVAP